MRVYDGVRDCALFQEHFFDKIPRTDTSGTRTFSLCVITWFILLIWTLDNLDHIKLFGIHLSEYDGEYAWMNKIGSASLCYVVKPRSQRNFVNLVDQLILLSTWITYRSPSKLFYIRPLPKIDPFISRLRHWNRLSRARAVQTVNGLSANANPEVTLQTPTWSNWEAGGKTSLRAAPRPPLITSVDRLLFSDHPSLDRHQCAYPFVEYVYEVDLLFHADSDSSSLSSVRFKTTGARLFFGWLIIDTWTRREGCSFHLRLSEWPCKPFR